MSYLFNIPVRSCTIVPLGQAAVNPAARVAAMPRRSEVFSGQKPRDRFAAHRKED
jgi:hypothetical protein